MIKCLIDNQKYDKVDEYLNHVFNKHYDNSFLMELRDEWKTKTQESQS